MGEEIKLDNWQKEVLSHEGNITIRAGRQVGKSTVIGIKAARFVRDNPGTTVLIISASKKQAEWLFDKILGEMLEMCDNKEIEFKREPTRTKIMLENGSQLHCLPAGRTGAFIRGLAIDLLIADEAAFIPENVWRAVLPMVAVSRKLRGFGWIILLSTPFGKGGYFYDTFHDQDFRQFHLSSEQCPRIPKEFLLKEKDRMSKAEYAQEYMGEFIDEYNQFFPTKLIKDCMTFIEWDTEKEYKPQMKYYLGVDIARYGGDENAFVINEMDSNNRIRAVKCLTTKRMSLTDTVGRIKKLNDRFNFKRIFIDDAGLGAGVYDMLVEVRGYDGTAAMKRKVIGLNNARRSIDRTDRKGAILKEDLYSNALVLMETGKINIISDLSLLRSLKCIVFEYTADRRIKIGGKYSHLAEAFVRACWCIRDKGLNIYLA